MPVNGKIKALTIYMRDGARFTCDVSQADVADEHRNKVIADILNWSQATSRQEFPLGLVGGELALLHGNGVSHFVASFEHVADRNKFQDEAEAAHQLRAVSKQTKQCAWEFVEKQ